MNRLRAGFVIGVLCISLIPGCQGTAEWEIVAENQGAVPCAITVHMEGRVGPSIHDLAPGKQTAWSLNEKVVIYEVEVKRKLKGTTDVQKIEIKPAVELRGGKRYRIIVAADGKVSTSLSDR